LDAGVLATRDPGRMGRYVRVRPSAVQVAGQSVAFEEALLVALGYCTGTEPVGWSIPRRGVGDPAAEAVRGDFAYRTYDAVRSHPGPRLEPIDVLVADGLNAQMRAKDIAGVLAVADQLTPELERIDRDDVCFWELDRDAVVTEPTDVAKAWPVWRAWTVLMGVAGIDVARCHKILHHKRPRVFPLLDNKTVSYLETDFTVWGAIHDDLTATRDAWALLEAEVGEHLDRSELPAPSRLRLHDILLCTSATGQFETARRYGASA
ncbi:MAG: DUF6308 family protein, partial [Pseudonocardiaceae bacterium]